MRNPWPLVLAGVGVSGTALGGNEDSFALGNDAALTGGAVTATTHSAEAVWYNPAGLAAAPHDSLDLTATAFAYRQRRIPKSGISLLPEQKEVRQDLSSKRLLIVPTSLALSRRLGQSTVFGAGVFVPRLDQYNFEPSLGQIDIGEGSRLRQQADIRGTQARYQAGVALGWAVSARYRIGLSLFGTYDTFDQVARFWWNLEHATTPPSTAVLLGEERLSLARTATDATLAVQTEPWDGFRLGVVLKAPRLLLSQSWGGDSITIGGFAGPAFEGQTIEPVQFEFTDLAEGAPKPALFSVVSPPRVIVALGMDYSRGHVALEADVTPALNNAATGLAARQTLNARVGGEYDAYDHVTFGAGLFTDRAQQATIAGFPGFRVDYYGVAFGSTFKKSLALAKSSDAVLFETTLAVRYAVGFGEAATLVFDFRDIDEGAFAVDASSPRDVVFHEAALHVGTGISF